MIFFLEIYKLLNVKITSQDFSLHYLRLFLVYSFTDSSFVVPGLLEVSSSEKPKPALAERSTLRRFRFG